MSVNRCYSEKKTASMSKHAACSPACDLLEIKNLTHVRYLCRYDAEDLHLRPTRRQRASYSRAYG